MIWEKIDFRLSTTDYRLSKKFFRLSTIDFHRNSGKNPKIPARKILEIGNFRAKKGKIPKKWKFLEAGCLELLRGPGAPERCPVLLIGPGENGRQIGTSGPAAGKICLSGIF